MKYSKKLGILTAVATLGLAGYLYNPKEEVSPNQNILPSNFSEDLNHYQNQPRRNDKKSNNDNISEVKITNQPEHESYNGPESLTNFLQKSYFQNPENFFGLAEEQLREFFNLQEDVFEWAEKNNKKRTLSDLEKKIYEKHGWEMGELELDFGKGIKYIGKRMNNKYSTTIMSPEVNYNFTWDSRRANEKDSINFFLIDYKNKERKESILKGEMSNKEWSSMLLNYDASRKSDNLIPMKALIGKLNPNSRVKNGEQRDIYESFNYQNLEDLQNKNNYSILDYRFSDFQKRAKELNNSFVKRFKNN